MISMSVLKVKDLLEGILVFLLLFTLREKVQALGAKFINTFLLQD